MLPAYAKAFFSAPPVVFGKRLRPFSLGHSFLLEAIGNPVAMGEPYSPQDAAVFAKVCTMTFAEALAFLNDEDAARKEMERMGAKCGGADWLAECAKIDEYFRATFECIPERWEQDGDKSEMRVPVQLAFFQVLRGTAAITPELENAIWDMPYGRAAAYAAVAGWAKGDESLMSEKESDLYAKVLELPQPRAI